MVVLMYATVCVQYNYRVCVCVCVQTDVGNLHSCNKEWINAHIFVHLYANMCVKIRMHLFCTAPVYVSVNICVSFRSISAAAVYLYLM